MAHVLNIGGLNAKLEKHGLKPKYVTYTVDANVLYDIFEKVVEEKTGQKVKLVFSADEEMDTLYTELDDDTPEEVLDALTECGLATMEGYNNTILILEWLTDIDESQFGIMSSAYFYEGRDGRDSVDIHVPVRGTEYTAVYTVGGIINEIVYGDNLDNMIEDMKAKLAEQEFDSETDDARIFDGYGHEVHSYDHKEA